MNPDQNSTGASTTEVGRAAEGWAARYLAQRGYRVVERNVRTLRGEIDLVAWDGDTLCFVEVKSRSRMDYGGAQAAIDQDKRRRVWKAAEAYLAMDDELWVERPECRFDVVAVQWVQEGDRGWWEGEVFRGAFEGEEGWW